MNSANQHQNAGNAENNPDPRQYPRKFLSKPVIFNHGDQKYKGLIKNISRGGVFIETRSTFFFGQSIELVISNNRVKKRKRVQGWIVHASSTGIGVTFRRILERRSGNERRNEIDRRSGSDRRKGPKRKNRRTKKTHLYPMMNYHT